MAIPSGDIEQPAERANADDAVQYALTRRHVEPSARHTSHDGGGGHCGHEGTCSTGHTHRIPRSRCPCNFGCWPEDEPEHTYIDGPNSK